MTKLVCRLLGADDRLLGWCQHEAVMRGDGYLRASAPVVVLVETCGTPHALSVHWADMNVETRVPIPPMSVVSGQALPIFASNAPMLQAGTPPTQRLPPVTTKAVLVSVPVGQLGAVGAA